MQRTGGRKHRSDLRVAEPPRRRLAVQDGGVKIAVCNVAIQRQAPLELGIPKQNWSALADDFRTLVLDADTFETIVFSGLD